MMMMMNCFCGMVDRRKVVSLISSRDHCQRSSPSRIFDMARAGFEPAQNLSSGLVEWSCAVLITTTPRRHKVFCYIVFHKVFYNITSLVFYYIPASNYMFKGNKKSTRTRCEIYSKLTIKTPEDVIDVILESLFLSLNIFYTLF